MTQKIKTAVIGVGHLGKAHARIHHSIENVDLVAVCDTNEAGGRAVAETYQTKFTADFRDLLGEVEAVSIATPTVNHHEVACACLEAGIHVLVEKPISRTLAEADEMIRLAEAKGLALQTGHIERFNPAFQALRQQLTNPKFFEAHRMGIFTPRSLDIDVVMDLMVHELDIIASLVKSEVVRIEAVGIPILTQKIDLANARLEFADGCIANITASRVAGERLRKLRVFQPNEYYSLDYAEQQVGMFKLIPPKTAGAMPEIVAQGLEIEKREPLLAEIESFLNAVRTRTAPIVTGAEGRHALALATEVLDKIKAHSLHAGIQLNF
ncbi:MAG TPA: Gfo/Idh/MocA family oxidoreductase [Blastocatellia bacterium]|nr:Gfo/Idh/MocA family oxidoreductase [Blastocatellia bacterium]HMV87487.1 Gfo/Idh/MocA family oxidoreductase [Blastocatellia bacterium]HMX29358.1 Gfo/Idh/MocA family oxidoreductase [Blastocatellia bacterium]HMY74798.1 Gfo/Idh/MocA family oxidoreductase [Blastocatellia bacterium]HMZ21680.1 Gfo/Idh/MocA family oxidoreductase [Blastocatellia bacterium]